MRRGSYNHRSTHEVNGIIVLGSRTVNRSICNAFTVFKSCALGAEKSTPNH